MNILRFPIQLRTGKNQFMRAERLTEREETESIQGEKNNSLENETTIVGRGLVFSSINKILNIKF
jgi:hypothetical protein